MNEPTKEQIQWLWEQCGIEKRFESDTGTWYYHYPNHQCDIELPPIDLNNLFKWAVSTLQAGGKSVELYAHEHKGYIAEVYDVIKRKWDDPISKTEDEDPALALFWAIYKALGGA